MTERFTPMLASSGPVPRAHARWAFEPKLDGWRVIVYVSANLRVVTRSGRSIADSVPELAALPDALWPRTAVLDGELIAGQGQPDDFYRLGPRLSATRPASVERWRRRVPLTFAAFDLLHLDGEDATRLPYSTRRRLLESLGMSGAAWCTVASYSDGDELMAACAELGLEGIVAKRRDSAYSPGHRSKDWIKSKTPAWRDEHAHRRMDRSRLGGA